MERKWLEAEIALGRILGRSDCAEELRRRSRPYSWVVPMDKNIVFPDPGHVTGEVRLSCARLYTAIHKRAENLSQGHNQ